MKQLLLLCFVALALSTQFQRQTLLRRDGPPSNSGWKLLRKAHQQEKVTFTISLEQQNLDKLEERFWANADPNSPVFAKHMTREEIIQLTASPVEVQKKVIRWIQDVENTLSRGNLIKLVNDHDAIVVTSTVKFAEKLFNTEMHVFLNTRNKLKVIKHMGELSVPSHVSSHITMITGITELPPVSKKEEKKEDIVKKQTSNNQCNNPYTIKNLYNVPQDLYITMNASASIYAEVSNVTDGFGLKSVEDYQQALDLPNNPITCILGNDASAYVQDDNDEEANLDTEMVTGIAPNVFTCFYVMDPGGGWMYEFARTVFSTPNAPPIVSISYGFFEDGQCDNANNGGGLGNCTFEHFPNSEAYVKATNIQFQKLGLLGHTLLAASGDDGVAGGQGSEDDCSTQGPTFPATSPFLTVVGATSVEASNQDDFDWRKEANPPSICTDSSYGCTCSTSTNEQPALSTNTAGFDTGGGFSFYNAQPKYQQAAVAAYLKSGVQLPASTYFNANNRAYPDVAGVGEQICLLDPDTGCNFAAGTSASCPLWAGLVSHLNNDRMKAGKTLLGFLNPVIYEMFAKGPQKYFNNGFSSGNNNGGCPESMGFNAMANQWTPLTGCGSPKFDQIRAYIASLP